MTNATEKTIDERVQELAELLVGDITDPATADEMLVEVHNILIRAVEEARTMVADH